MPKPGTNRRSKSLQRIPSSPSGIGNPRVLEVSVPIPKSDQNKRGGRFWQEANRRKKDVKAAQKAVSECLSLLSEEEKEELGLPWPNMEVHVKWYHPTRRFRDIWNIVGCLKGTIDGIVRSGVVLDDEYIQPPRIDRLVDRDNPHVTLLLSRAEIPKESSTEDLLKKNRKNRRKRK